MNLMLQQHVVWFIIPRIYYVHTYMRYNRPNKTIDFILFKFSFLKYQKQKKTEEKNQTNSIF